MPYILEKEGFLVREDIPSARSTAEIGWSWVGGFLGIAAVAYLNYSFLAESALLVNNIPRTRRYPESLL